MGHTEYEVIAKNPATGVELMVNWEKSAMRASVLAGKLRCLGLEAKVVKKTYGGER